MRTVIRYLATFSWANGTHQHLSLVLISCQPLWRSQCEVLNGESLPFDRGIDFFPWCKLSTPMQNWRFFARKLLRKDSPEPVSDASV